MLFCLLFQAQTFAATYVVTTNTDPDNTQGSCAANGACTLRQAINTANAVAGDDVINFAAGLSGQTILLTPALMQLSITSNITINALAVTNVSVSGGGRVRVFFIGSAVVVMTGFRITGGNGSGSSGGAIQNIGNLTLNNMVVQANTATNILGGGIYTVGTGNRLTINGGSILGNSARDGGGIYGDNGIINLTNVTVSGNTAVSNGGGIYTIGGTLNITGGSVTGNTATNRFGGGIYTNGTTVTVTNASITNNHADNSSNGIGGGMTILIGSSTITNSIVSGNTAQRRGGGIYFSGGTHSITGTTLSGNSAGSGTAANNFFGGGGLVNEGANVNISNSTVSRNTSGCDCGGGGITTFALGTTNLRNVTIANNTASAGPGGGINSIVGTIAPGTNNLGNTVVADNTASTNPDVNGAIVSQGFNLVRMRGTSTGYVVSDLPDGSNPRLEALGNNGGLTQTHRLLAGSAAIDKGSNALAVNQSNGAALTTDQRGTGFVRIRDGNGDGTAIVDIGAFEVQAVPTAASVSVSGRITARGRGISSAVVHLTNQNGEIQTARTNRLGYYTFTDLAVGETYIFNVFSKRYQFDPKVINLTEDLSEVDFTAQ